MPDRSDLTPGMVRKRHPSYDAARRRWDFAKDHYDDRGLYDALDRDGDVPYLPQKKQGEHAQEYIERKKLAHYPNLLGPTLDSFTGLLFHKDTETEREWGGLGDPDEEGSLAHRITTDADGMGTDHEAQLKQLSTDLLLFQKAGLFVDTNKSQEDEGITQQQARQRGIRPSWKLIPPQAIVNWREDDDGRVVEALVQEVADTRESLADLEGDAEQERFLWLDLDGWLRVVEDKDDSNDLGLKVLDGGSYDYTNLSGQPTLPLFIATLPISRYPAYSLAKANNAIFNGLSELRWSLRKGSFPRWVFSGSDTAFETFLENVKKGVVAVQENLSQEDNGKGHRWATPGMEPADMHLKVKELLVKDFWRQAMYEFSDTAVQRTATEITAEFVSSIGAFLNILAGSLDEAENEALRLLEQAAGVTPGEAFVTRPRDYTVQDGVKLANELRKALFGEMGEVPLPSEAKAEASKRILRLTGVTNDDNAEDLEDAVDRESELEADRQRLLGDAIDAAAEEEPQTVGEARQEGVA